MPRPATPTQPAIPLLNVILLLVAVAFSGPGCSLHAQSKTKTSPSQHAEGEAIVDLRSLTLIGGDAAQMGELTVLNQPEGAAGRAYRVKTTGTPSAKWAVQLRARTSAPISKGDVVFATFKARSAGSMVGDATTEFVFERAAPDWEKSAALTVTVGLAWTDVFIPFRAQTDLEAGEAQISFRVGYASQAIDIAEIRVMNLGPDYALDTLPMTARTYAGMEPDAPWRAEAQRRIEEHRMADLTVRVVDEQGTAVPNVDITVEMTQHAFRFGSAVVADVIATDHPDHEKYRQVIAENFNEVVFENDLKWRFSGRDFGNVDKAMAWLESKQITIRGHCLIWPSWRHAPAELRRLNDAGDHGGMRKLIAERIADAAGRYAGRIADWDVMNEVYQNHDVVDTLGEPAMVDWYKQAHAVDPDAKLYINDYGILTGGGRDETHQAAYEQTIRYLLEQDAPLHGIGMQGHFGQTLTPPKKLLEVLDRFARLGLTLKVTEFDIAMDDEAMQAAYVRDFLTTMYSHPDVEGVVMWGFWERRHWRPNAALWRADWSPKPAVEAFRSLLYDAWWTEADGKTDTNGVFSVRGHLGTYRITASNDTGRHAERSATLANNGSTVEIVLR